MTDKTIPPICERLSELRVVLKSGEYDGADLMRAWCAMMDARETIIALVSALEFYARAKTYEHPPTGGLAVSATPVSCDRGERARTTLFTMKAADHDNS